MLTIYFNEFPNKYVFDILFRHENKQYTSKDVQSSDEKEKNEEIFATKLTGFFNTTIESPKTRNK